MKCPKCGTEMLEIHKPVYCECPECGRYYYDQQTPAPDLWEKLKKGGDSK